MCIRDRDGPLSLDDLRVLYEIERNGSVSVSRTVDLLGVEETAARRVLARLIYQRFVQMTPDRSAVRFAGGIDEGVLGPGSSNGRPSRERMEKQIRQFVQKHGSISRSQAAELCEIEPVLAG